MAFLTLRPRDPLLLTLSVCLWITTVGNFPWWAAWMQQAGPASGHNLAMLLGLVLLMMAVLSALLCWLGWRWTLRPGLSLLLLVTACGAYFMDTYGVVIDPTMMMNVLHTDAREVRDLANWRLLWHVLLIAGPPMALIWSSRWPAGLTWRRQLGRNLALFALAAGLALASGWWVFADVASAMRNHRSMRYLINPLNSLYAAGRLVAEVREQAGPLQPIGQTARPAPRPPGSKPPLLLLVVGETARSDHFALNGYPVPTTPQLGRLPASELVSLRDVTSCGTSTAASLPCMFSPLGRSEFLDSDGVQENLLDLLQHAGLAVLWLDNQSGCKRLCDRVPHEPASLSPPGVAHPDGLCDDEECFDAALLTGLEVRLNALPAERRAQGVVLVMHQMGSHGPAYAKRSPATDKPFLPECTTNVLQDCDSQALVHAYDNSIAYTDQVLGRAQRWLAQQSEGYDPSLLYVSDHGESLGENNLYLHGLPYAVAPRVQKHVPWVMWLPGPTQAALTLQMSCLSAQRDRPFSHDNLFHTVLGLARVQAAEYRPELDILRSCRGG